MNSNSPKKILIVDDMEDNRFIIKLYLRKLNFTCIEAINGKTAFSKYKTEKPDLILMDIQMPTMSGFESTKLIRSYEVTNNFISVPIVALTAYKSDDYLTAALESGFTEYLKKPINKKILIDTVSKYLNTNDHDESK